MKMIENLRRMSDDQLKNRLCNIEPEIHRAEVISHGWKTEPNGNVKVLHNLKKEKARILTLLHERKHKV